MYHFPSEIVKNNGNGGYGNSGNGSGSNRDRAEVVLTVVENYTALRFCYNCQDTGFVNNQCRICLVGRYEVRFPKPYEYGQCVECRNLGEVGTECDCAPDLGGIIVETDLDSIYMDEMKDKNKDKNKIGEYYGSNFDEQVTEEDSTQEAAARALAGNEDEDKDEVDDGQQPLCHHEQYPRYYKERFDRMPIEVAKAGWKRSNVRLFMMEVGYYLFLFRMKRQFMS